MQLLVSVATAAEADAAIAGGAHIVDAKDPATGALGAVTRATLREIRRRVPASTPLSAAIGDAADEASVEHDARSCAAAGVTFVKIGFAGTTDAGRAGRLLEAAVRGASAGNRQCGVVAVAYADAAQVASLPPHELLHIAARSAAIGVLLDTADKHGPGLCARLPHRVIAAWVAEAQQLGLRVALAGKLTPADIAFVRDTGADIAGVRGMVCDGGRTGRVVSAKVRALVELVGGDGDHGEAGRECAGEVGIDKVAG